MILVAGIPDESPVARVVEELEAMGADFRVFDQRDVLRSDLALDIGDASTGGRIGGCLRLRDEAVPLYAIDGIYLRPMDDQLLPEVASLPPDSPHRLHARRLHELLMQFADMAPARVLNRPRAMASNQSKPYQAGIIRANGFRIPETLITNDPACARAFIEGCWRDGGEAVFKSLSGVRSIVQKAGAADVARLDRVRWCPTQFQRLVPGTDVRVHVVGTRTIAVAIDSEATDYRYAARQTGVDAALREVALEPGVHERCVGLARALDLPLAGIDLRRTPSREFVCFEVNPSPAFTYYEERAGVPIGGHIAAYLARQAD